MGNRRRIKVGVDTLPIPASSGSAPDDAPYLLNGVDPSGDLTAQVNVLTLATPQPFIATAPIGGDVGLPVILAYDDGPGAVDTGVGLAFRAQNDADAPIYLGSVLAQFSDATDGSEDSKLVANVYAAGAEVTALTIDNSGIVLEGTGNKTITTATGDFTVSATGAGNDIIVESAAAAARLRSTAAGVIVTGATTAAVTAGTGDLSLASGAGDVAVLINATPIASFVTTGLEFRGTGSKVLSYQGGDLAAGTAGAGNDLGVSSGGDMTIAAGTTAGSLVVTSQSTASVTALAGDLTLDARGAGTVILSTGNTARWAVTTAGVLQAQGASRKISSVAPGTTTGDAVAFEQILDAGVATPTNGGATVAIVPGAEFIATATFTAPTGGAGTFLLQNNTGRAITLIGARAIIAGAGVNTLAITVDNAGGTDLLTVAALAATGGTHIPAATTYTLGNAIIANGANIIITAEGSGATIDTILFLEFIAQ
jgi:hypothetical protein